MKKLYFFILLVASAGIISCKSASKLYQKGNYDEAVEVAVKKLQKKPHDAELQDILVKAYDYAVDDHEARIRNYEANSSDLKWDWIYNEYLDLQRLHDAIFRAPEVFDIVRPHDYSADITAYADKAADAHLSRGDSWMQNQDRESYKRAYREFQAALRFNPGDLNIKQRMDEAYGLAVVNVVIMPTDPYGFQFSSYNPATSQFGTDLLQALQYNTGNEFVQFYSSWDARNRGIVPDEIIEMKFTNLNIGRVYDERSVRDVSREVVVKETVYSKDSVVKEYKKVKARITTTKRTVYSEGVLALGVHDEQGRWIMNEDIVGQNRWVNVFSRYTGDERALSEEDMNLVKQGRDIQPREEDIIRNITDDIYQQLINRIRNHYSRY